ncbi:MAG: DNA-processing protein DprA [Candidatus Abyssubacteria bacterium]
MDEVRHWLELSLIPGVGPKTFFKLLDYFGSPQEALKAPTAALRQVHELSGAVAEAVSAGAKKELENALRIIDQHGIHLITYNSPDYPERLRTIHDPPPLLYVKGTICPEDTNSISIVGSRRATHYGKMTAAKLAADLARMGITVISGLAYGVDAAAHRGALEAGGRTVAVLGCGVDVIYPRANLRLFEHIPGAGALISELPMGTQPDPGFFPMRNRIVSGLSLGTLVVEAPRKSGALITARLALEQGREVFAVPGNIFSPYSEGCHSLIKDGAKLVENVYDIICEIERGIANITLDKPQSELPNAANVALSVDEKKVFNLLSMVPIHIDEVCEQCDLTASRTASALMTLELKGLVQQLSGKNFIRRSR